MTNPCLKMIATRFVYVLGFSMTFSFIIISVLSIKKNVSVATVFKYQRRHIPRDWTNSFHSVARCRPVKFANPPLPVTALVSFPGSGNTWFRHLIQIATGVYTGSVYSDTTLKDYGFPGDGIFNGSVITVKVHQLFSPKTALFKRFINIERVILLIRDPLKASTAEMNRLHAGHTGFATDTNMTRDFPLFLKDAIPRWKSTYVSWLNVTDRVIVVYYENLLQDLIGEMTRVFHFLNVSVSDEDLNCMAEYSEGDFHRKTNHKTSKTLSEEMVRYINNTRQSLERILREKC